MVAREGERKNWMRSLMAILAILLMAGGCSLPWQSAETTDTEAETATASEEGTLPAEESEANPEETSAASEGEVAVTTTEERQNNEETMKSFQRAFSKLDAASLITYEGKFQGVPALCISTKDLCIELLLDIKGNAVGVIIAQDFGNDEWRSLTIPKGAEKRDLVIQNINAFKYNPKLPHTGHNAFLGEARSCDAVEYIDGRTIEGTYKNSDTTFKAYLINDSLTAISTAANYDVNIYPANFEDKDNFETCVRILQDMSSKMELMQADSQGYIPSIKNSVDLELLKLYQIIEAANTVSESDL